MMYYLAVPLVRLRISPHAVTALAVGMAGVAVIAASGGRWGSIVAIVLIVASTLLDGLDGAVAVLSNRVSAWGSALDSVADRVSDMCFFAAAAVVGVPMPLVLVAAGLTLLQESARARAGAVGMTQVGVLTVWERPSRMITVVLILAAHSAFPTSEWMLVAGGAVGTGLAVIGTCQLLAVVHRLLEPSPN